MIKVTTQIGWTRRYFKKSDLDRDVIEEQLKIMQQEGINYLYRDTFRGRLKSQENYKRFSKSLTHYLNYFVKKGRIQPVQGFVNYYRIIPVNQQK